MTNYDWASGLAIQSAVLLITALILAMTADSVRSWKATRWATTAAWVLLAIGVVGAVASAWVAAAGGLL